MESPREQMEARAQEFIDRLDISVVSGEVHDLADFAASEVLRALYECANLACQWCKCGTPLDATYTDHHKLGSPPSYVPCRAIRIFAKITSLTSKQP